MVKRKGNLISSLCNISNILLADSNARKAKKRSKRFIEKHDQNIIDEDMAIAVSFYNLSYKTSPYVTYKIYEPKERLICGRMGLVSHPFFFIIIKVIL